ncbi:CotH kinase family protein [Crenothrix polyspora]|uniref:CotH protein n=1 Tax=Crenothrix polyspora TaxID=360316 RepID=A0A1R4H4Z0_9GAMM|nr:CotH kinase family protein [Crenothrix polyspora]SJM91323.1 exported hypothetical protein [Crenothrix polyspora]
MRHKLKLCLMLAVTAKALLLTGVAYAASLVPFNLQMNDVGVGIDGRNTTKPRLFVSLDKGFSKAKPFDPVLKYNRIGGYVFECGGVKVKSGEICHFKPLKYGDSSQVISLYKGAVLDSTYTVVFTNLPVIELRTAKAIVDNPKVQGTLRLMSAEFKQDTGLLPMGIETAGQTSQNYKEKPYGVQLGTSTAGWNVAKNYPLLDMPSRDDWRLDPAYRDTTKARNRVVADLYRTIANQDKNRPKAAASIKGQSIELILNGVYQGIYVLEEKVDRALLDLKKVNVLKAANGQPDWAAVDFSKPENFSVLYKADYEDWNTPDGSLPVDAGTDFVGPTSTLFAAYTPGEIERNFSVVYPKTTGTPQYAPLIDLIDFVVNSDDVSFTQEIGTRIDLKSLANWWLLVQLSQGNDNIGKNFFIARNAGPTPVDRKFFVVPWDGDATFGMLWNGKPEAPSSYFDVSSNNLIRRLLENPGTGFSALLKSQWNGFRQGVDAPFTEAKILARFASYESQLTLGGAKLRDAEKWPKPDTAGVGNPKIATARYIGNFLKLRLPAMDSYISKL